MGSGGDARLEALALRVLPDGGALLDLPARSLHGFPLPWFEASPGGLAFGVGEGGPGSMSFEAAPDATDGSLRGRSRRVGPPDAVGELVLVPAPLDRGDDLPWLLEVGGGRLRGSLLLPPGRGPFPVVLILGGAGPVDRDGDSWAVPGRNGSLRLLARALRERGVASLRYDKRGAGESYLLAPGEENLRFDDYVSDARAVLRSLRADPQFSSVLVVGHAEGALVGAAALRAEPAAGAGLALLCAGARSARDALDEALSTLDEATQAEAGTILGALAEGRVVEEVSPLLADFFRPAVQPWLASWLRRGLVAELSGLRARLLFAGGARDLQVPPEDFRALAATRPEAPAYLIPGMNHILKAVGPDTEDNFRAWSEEGYPLAEGLADLLAAFAAGRDLPAPAP